MAKDSHWIEHAKAKGQIRKGAYGHHSAAQIKRDINKGGKVGKRAQLARTFAKMRAKKSLYG
jgi:hypothetical protein